jgi:hypothetical protein
MLRWFSLGCPALQVLGNAKGVVAVVASVLYFRNPVNIYSGGGYAITVTGVVLYSQVRGSPQCLGSTCCRAHRFWGCCTARQRARLRPVPSSQSVRMHSSPALGMMLRQGLARLQRLSAGSTQGTSVACSCPNACGQHRACGAKAGHACLV